MGLTANILINIYESQPERVNEVSRILRCVAEGIGSAREADRIGDIYLPIAGL